MDRPMPGWTRPSRASMYSESNPEPGRPRRTPHMPSRGSNRRGGSSYEIHLDVEECQSDCEERDETAPHMVHEEKCPCIGAYTIAVSAAPYRAATHWDPEEGGIEEAVVTEKDGKPIKDVPDWLEKAAAKRAENDYEHRGPDDFEPEYDERDLDDN